MREKKLRTLRAILGRLRKVEIDVGEEARKRERCLNHLVCSHFYLWILVKTEMKKLIFMQSVR